MTPDTMPKTLHDATVYFSDPDNCHRYLTAKRWPDGVVKCPTCGSENVSFVPSRRLWQCKTRHPKCQFSIKVGTIFEDSPIPLNKWIMAMWLIANCKNGVSSYEIHRDIGVSQKSAWFMLHRIREAMRDASGVQLGHDAPVEIDETFVGGKAKNMHKSKRKAIPYQGHGNKAVVLGMLERGGRVRARVIKDRFKRTIDPHVTENVVAGANIHTDEMAVYPVLTTKYVHDIINHMESYVRGHVHTNGIENFWALLKRGLGGTYISVEPFHLSRYVEEQMFRYNNRRDKDDAGRFDLAVSQIVGRRLTYVDLTGKTAELARPF